MNFRPMTPLLALTLTLHTTGVSAQREQFSLNNNWQFRLSQDVERLTTRRVDLPHTWNAQDALVGRTDYKRGIGNYEKKLPVPLDWKGKRIFLRFEGANTITDVFVNGQHSGHHEGGYGAFVFEITDKVAYGQDNTLLVRVNNGETLEVMPLTGDFNHYGGLYRDVHVVVTSPICISPLDHGSPGVRLVQDSVSHEFASVRAIVDVTNAPDAARDAVLRLRLLDGDDEVLAEEAAVSLPQGGAATREIGFTLRDPHLWDGREDPFIYTVEVSLLVDGTAADVVRQPLGLRFFEIDPDKGFFLNGRHLQLKGVCRHQDRAEVGNALRREHHDEDAAFIADIGANAVRAARVGGDTIRRPGRLQRQGIHQHHRVQGERQAAIARVDQTARQPPVNLYVGTVQRADNGWRKSCQLPPRAERPRPHRRPDTTDHRGIELRR